MKKSRFTDSQISSILKVNEAGSKLSGLCREYDMNQMAFYKWRNKFGSMNVFMIKHLKEPEAEIAWLQNPYSIVNAVLSPSN